MKKVADEVKDYIDDCIESFTPSIWMDDMMRWYLKGIVGGASGFDKLSWSDREDILEDHLPMALKWFAMRREVEKRG